MVMGISFNRGVFFHDRTYLACAEMKHGVIHVWSEKITLRTIGKMWVRIAFTLPWYYQLFHLMLLCAVLFGVAETWFDPLWILVYAAGFHFIFPRQLKKYHGAEHKVFSYNGPKHPEAWEAVKRANIVNSGCSTNSVTYFFLCFLASLPFTGALEWSVLIGFAGMAAAMVFDRYLRRIFKPVYWLSGVLQKYVTCKEPDRAHLETAIRSYQLLMYMRETQGVGK
ncbi:DUF1385 domain-containing protein [Brevibacillus fluminis]|uniref:DUF1385 domain-containing protein n=1 Tax=Brevibacillus fluminis TaxID=511487 RepID=UPI003F8ABA27